MGRFEHDKYAHEFFDDPIFDGMLLSKTVVTERLEEYVRQAGGVHRFYRLPLSVPVMGDCGAFSYSEESKPPYDIGDILEYYETLGFTSGVALDHLIFPSMPTSERERRFVITLDNAQAFISQHRIKGHQFQPVGIVQGWDPHSRRQALEQLIEMGYKRLAIGGMAISTDKQLNETLEAIHDFVPKISDLHIFGVARLSMIESFIRYGVTSADSASPMRRAFLGTSEDNYWTQTNERYAAIRIPAAKVGASRKRGVRSTEEVILNSGVDLETMKAMEGKALFLLRQYDKGEATLDDTLKSVLAYDRLHGDHRDHEAHYRRTLEDKPWQKCGCNICERHGVEVIIFRGNNRNRRRGFHNVKVFYDRLRKEVSKFDDIVFDGESIPVQLRLNL